MPTRKQLRDAGKSDIESLISTFGGYMKVAKLLIAKDAPVDAEGKNGVTPLHVAVHYDNQNVAMLLKLRLLTLGEYKFGIN